MLKNKLLPIGIVASVLILSGMMMAASQTEDTSVQTVEPATVAPTGRVAPLNHRGGKRGRDGMA